MSAYEYFDTCLMPDCARDIYCRGVCRACYNTLHKQVQKGETTWEELEEADLVLPSERQKSPALRALERLRRKS